MNLNTNSFVLQETGAFYLNVYEYIIITMLFKALYNI